MSEVCGTVLVVDDLAQNVRLMDAVLSPRGYTVVGASSGRKLSRSSACTCPT